MAPRFDIAKQVDLLGADSLLPPSKYVASGAGAILCDPPWQFSTWSPKGRDRCPDAPMTRNESRRNNPERHYKTMTLDSVKALRVGDIAAKDCLLFLWATDPMIPQAIAVGQGWGFTFKTVGFYWIKTRRETSTRGAPKDYPMGTGYWTRANPEQCLLFSRGHPKRLSASVRKLIVSPRRDHSQKPDEIYGLIEQLVSGPYVELFARQRWPGWHAWGDQVDKFSVTYPRPGAAEREKGDLFSVL